MDRPAPIWEMASAVAYDLAAIPLLAALLLILLIVPRAALKRTLHGTRLVLASLALALAALLLAVWAVAGWVPQIDPFAAAVRACAAALLLAAWLIPRELRQ